MMQAWTIGDWRVPALATGLVALLLGLVQATGLLLPLDRLLYPLLQKGAVTAAMPAVAHIHRSNVGTPWPRDQLAALLDVLADAGVRRIGLDLDLSTPGPDGGNQDARLAAAIRRAGTVVVRVHISDGPPGGPEEHPPLPLLTTAAIGSGHDAIVRGADGIDRVPLLAGIGGAQRPAFSALLAEQTLPLDRPRTRNSPSRTRPTWQEAQVVHLRPRWQMPVATAVTDAAILSDPRLRQRLRGQRVLISEDRCLQSMTCPDAEGAAVLQARAVSSLLASPLVRDLPRGPASALLLVGLAMAGGLMTRRHSALAWLALLLLVTATSWGVLHAAQWWWSPGPLLVSVPILAAVHAAGGPQRRAGGHPLTSLVDRSALQAALQRQSVLAAPCSLVLLMPVMASTGDGRYLHERDAAGWHRFCQALAAHPRRPADQLGHWDQGCLALLLPGTPAEGAERLAGTLSDLVGSLQYVDIAGRRRRLALAVGIASAASSTPWSAQELGAIAAACLQQARRIGGRACICQQTAG